MVSMNIITI